MITGKVGLQGSNGNTLHLSYNPQNLLPILIRNGVQHNWSKQFDLYKSKSFNNQPVISLGWKQGKLQVQAGELRFDTNVTEWSQESEARSQNNLDKLKVPGF